MCGICGVWEYGRQGPSKADALRGMLPAIEHRGPDDEGTFVDDAVALGSRRLSIIDLPGGSQPITNEDETVVIVFNGEIYNYRELRAGLLRRGHSLRSASDTEVIVHLYEDLGEDCVRELDGMFAFALWDARKGRLLLVRDRLGIKPLYYATGPDRVVFASEIKALLQHPSVAARLDLPALGNFLSLKYVPAPQTMFEGITALPPGHMLSCGPSGIALRCYWDVSYRREGPAASEHDYAEQLVDLLRASVHSQLVSDVPFGAFLSGGVDSSTVVALMSQFLEQPVKTFAVGYAGDGAEASELPYARMVAERYGTDHHEVLITPRDFIDQAEKVVWHLDQPIADDACLANYMVARLARRHVKMVLTGEGGDELFAGYARYVGERFAPAFKLLPRGALSLLLRASGRLPLLRRPKLALYALSQRDDLHRMTAWFPLFNTDMRAELATGGLELALEGRSADEVFGAQLARSDAGDALSRMLYVDTKLWLPDDLLARGDKMSMAASLEARVPLLDHRLVEFAAQLPPNMKVRRLARKYLLKRVAREWLPPAIIERPKQGFPVPISLWFRREAREFLRDNLSESAVRARGLFEPAYVRQLLERHDSGHSDHGSLLWGLLSVELWHQLYIDKDPRLALASSR
jgi:asparagine synthase (glutamine-hydrolysing)